MKKRLISISLAVLLAMVLGIMIFPTQAVEASYDHKQGIVYHIEAEGPATFDQAYPSGPEVDGELYIKLNGSGNFYIMGRGLAWHGGGGKLKGSFDNNEIDLLLQAYRVVCNKSHVFYPNLKIEIWFWAMGLYNGEKVQHDWKSYKRSYGKLFLKPHATEPKLTIDKIRLHLYDKNNGSYVYWIYMDESTADIFNIDIDIVGY